MPPADVMGDPKNLELRPPRPTDAAAMWRLVRDGGTLDLNSPYLYLLICTDFAASSLVAVEDDELLGFVAAYRPPPEPAALFVWQIGVVPTARGRGLAKGLLTELLQRPGSADARVLTATVTPDNAASLALFRSLARDLGVEVRQTPRFGSELFPDGGDEHQPEMELRLGPLSRRSRTAAAERQPDPPVT